MFSKIKNGVLATGVAASALMAAGSVSAEDLVVMLLPENVNARWEKQDAFFFKQAMSEMAPDATVEVFNANNDVATQQRQAEQALTRGAKVLVVIPIDGEAAAIIADAAEEEGVPAIAYDRMMQSPNTDFWVQADMFATGAAQAQHVVDRTKEGDTLVLLKGSPTDPNAGVIYNGQMSVLQPLFDSGERVLGYENWTPGWDPAIARRSMDQALTQLNNNVQGVVSSNDGNAGAAIASMAEQTGLVGNVPVTGLDCTVQALQLILLGEQTQCVWRPFEEMATVTAKVVTALLNGDDTSNLVQGTVKNDADADIPFVPVDYYEAVGTEGVAYVIEHDLSVTKDAVCEGVAADTDFCKS
ncbi:MULTISPECIES: sugar ABC transporter substrate-binding protein [Alphaproteobacteria]|uniref:ABC transporter substrate-binding protein n=1 Tax=Alphaproteobacteria TaxID=28211 RepID=UPI003A924899